jgi:hypothetical protein
MTTYPTIPAEDLRVGHCINWEGEGCSVEDVYDQPDDESVYLTVCFDEGRPDESVTIPYGTAVSLLHQCQFERWKASQQTRAAKHDRILAGQITEHNEGRVGETPVEARAA